jgi:hypothetical protein
MVPDWNARCGNAFGGIAVPNANGTVWDRLVGLVHCKDTTPKILNKYTPRKGIAQPQSQFPHLVSVSLLYIPTIGLPILLQKNKWTDQGI